MQVSRLYAGDAKTQARSQDLLNKIGRSRTLSRKAEVLRLLCKLSDSAQTAN